MVKKKDTPGEGGSPYQPYKPKPSGPYTPAPSRDSIKIASSSDAAGDMTHVTEKGFFLDPNGDAYINTPNGLLFEGGYDPDIHGIIVPLAKRKSLNIAQFPRLSTGEPMTNIEEQQGIDVLKKLKGNQKRKQLKIFMDQYMKGV